MVERVKLNVGALGLKTSLVAFPGSSVPEREIEFIHAGIFSHVRTLKGREGVERP